MSLKLFSLALLAVANATPLEKVTREECKPCNPQGATGSTPPAVGPELKSLYVDVLASVKGISFKKRWDDSLEPRQGSFCCRETLDCVNVQNFNIPMCYDKFTTSFGFPGNAFGSLTTGNYTVGGDTANLINGQYTKAGGETGDIYAEDPSAKPNTATMSIPPQWTAAGVGSAIPASELGYVTVITTTISGTTFSGPTVLPESTIIETHGDHTTAVSTRPAQTITGATTIPAQTSTVTSTVEAQETSSSTGAAAQVGATSNMPVGMSLFTALMYALYAL
ncbi:hypothetical protein BS50DRAFT_602287 [Corynespora cassiicola Philippines]|uniref:Uncharacterized protein n=1 Tax=Corynespora cassiicola Philippines TaxID=1448308 RepID=A0A2T2NHG4_CORCC|nr:hypothetical protein BS50DRAFT_602287 [Corynespora cassiicola Philippines]